MPARQKWLTVLGTALAVVGLAACAATYVVYRAVAPLFQAAQAPSPTPQPPPCGGAPGSSLDLGIPTISETSDGLAEFTTSGKTLYITASGFLKGLFDFDGVPRLARIYVGDMATLPAANQQTGQISNVRYQVDVVEGSYSTITLPAGRYWMWSSSMSAKIRLQSCDPHGVSDPVPQYGKMPVLPTQLPTDTDKEQR